MQMKFARQLYNAVAIIPMMLYAAEIFCAVVVRVNQDGEERRVLAMCVKRFIRTQRGAAMRVVGALRSTASG